MGRGYSYIPTLDGWRTLAVALVIVDHLGDDAAWLLRSLGLSVSTDPAVLADLKSHCGKFGVRIFFILSGYLITTLLAAEYDRTGRLSLKSFYLRRLFRIQPAAMAYLLVVLILSLVAGLPIDGGSWAAAALMVGNLYDGASSQFVDHYWSLAVEEHFYLLWPFTLAIVGRRRALLTSGLLLLVFMVWRTIVCRTPELQTGEIWTLRTDLHAAFLMVGCLIALARASEWRDLVDRFAKFGMPLYVVLAVSSFLSLNHGISGQLLSLAGAMSIGLLMVHTSTHPKTPWSRALELRPIAAFGRMSFSFYLWQQLFLMWEAKRLAHWSPIQSLPFNLLGAVLCAWLSYTFIEQPVLRYGRAWMKGRREPSAGVSS